MVGPFLSGSSVGGSTGVAYSGLYKLNFSGLASLGSGYIYFYRSDGTLIEKIDVTDYSQVTVNNGAIIIDPNLDLTPSTTYYVTMEAGIVRDTAGLTSPAVTSTTAVRFTTGTAAPAPTVISAGQNSAVVTLTQLTAPFGQSLVNRGVITATGYGVRVQGGGLTDGFHDAVIQNYG